MSTALTLGHARRPDGGVLVTATGEIDMSNVQTLAEALADASRDAGDGPIVVDLTAVEYIDSAGLAALYPHVDRLRLTVTPLLAPVLTIAGLDDLITVTEG